MATPKLANRKMAKLKFFAVYALSVLLIVIVLSSFLKINTAGVERRSGSASPLADHRKDMDDLLHRQMDKLQNACVAYAQSNTSKEATDALWQEEEGFSTLVDSIRKTLSSLPEATQRTEAETLLDAFNREAKKQISLVKSLPVVSHDSSAVSDSGAVAQLNELKGILVQKEQTIQDLKTQNQVALQDKDKTIAALQDKLNSQSSAPTKGESGGGEWKDKYEKLKAVTDKLRENNDKYGAQISELKSSYKAVVDDNKRLVGQLQSLRAGKNQ
jgi:chromosome segregation ATPase